MPSVPQVNDMVNMTLAVPAELHEMMRKHKDVHWAEVAREAFWRKAREMEFVDRAKKWDWMDKVASKSKLTAKDVDEISHKIKRDIAAAHGIRV